MTIKEKARAYAESVIDSFGTNGVPCGIKDIKHMITEGYFAGATEALASQWVSVRVGLPEDRQQIIYRYRWRNPKTGIWHDSGIDACRYDKDFGFRTDNENVLCWMPVPPLK